MKQILDLGPAVAFFVAYYLGDIYTATLTVIIALFVTVAGYWLLERRVHKLHLAAALAALVFGGLTLYVRDPTFIKFKPTMMYCLLATVLLGSHVIGKKVLLQRLPQTMVVMPDLNWRRLNAAWAVFFYALAGVNLFVATQFSEEIWVQFRTYGYSIITFVFLLAQLPFLTRYMPQQEEDKP